MTSRTLHQLFRRFVAMRNNISDSSERGGGAGGGGGGGQVYTAELDVWKLAPPMPTYRCGMGVATLGGLVYVAGGWNGEPLETVEIYNVSNSSWSTGKPITRPRQDASATAVDGKIILAGGCIR
eukprot:COSAG06_NODE_1132_length_10582_cov_5.539826_12_plen_124_part_00